MVTGFTIRNVSYVNHFMRLRGPDVTNHVRVAGYSFLHNLLHMTGERILQPYANINLKQLETAHFAVEHPDISYYEIGDTSAS